MRVMFCSRFEDISAGKMLQSKIFWNNRSSCKSILTEIQKQNIHFSGTISRNSNNLKTDFDGKKLHGKN